MGFFDRVKERYLEPEKDLHLDEEQIQVCSSDGDVQQKAKQLLQSAVADLDSEASDNNIFRVRECLDILGGECEDKRIIINMITRVAKSEPNVLKADGQKRLEAIRAVVETIGENMHSAIKKNAETMEAISQKEEAEKETCASDIQTLNRQYEEEVARLKAELESKINARNEDSEALLAELEAQRSRSEQEKKYAEDLNREVVAQSNTLTSEISMLLEYLDEE